jgi:hypothetical protein
VTASRGIRWWGSHWAGSRTVASAAVGFAVAGTAALAVAVSATAVGFGYVSEAGAPGAPLSGVYRSGIFAIAVSLALLAASLRRGQSISRASGPLIRAATLALAAAAPLAGVSGVVSCTPGCPLPPYETPGATDLVHAAASMAALLLAAAAMTSLAVDPGTDERLRRISRVGAGLAVPLLAATGLAMLLLGRGYVSGLLERAALIAALSWLVAAGMLARGAIRANPPV